MLTIGLKTVSDLKKISKSELLIHFGKAGTYFYNIAHGMDDRPVNSNRIRKSLGKETTLHEDIDDRAEMLKILEQIALKIESLIRTHEIRGTTLTLKIKYADFQSVTRSITDTAPVSEANVMMAHLRKLLETTEAGKRKVRLLGITISNFADETEKGKHRQLLLPFSSA